MTRNNLAVAVHSLYASLTSDHNLFYHGCFQFGSDWHYWYNEAGFISKTTLDVKSIRALRSMPVDHLFRNIKAIMMGVSIYLEEGYYGFSGMESAVSDITIDSSWDELRSLLGWFNGVVPWAFQPQDDGTIKNSSQVPPAPTEPYQVQWEKPISPLTKVEWDLHLGVAHKKGSTKKT